LLNQLVEQAGPGVTASGTYDTGHRKRYSITNANYMWLTGNQLLVSAYVYMGKSDDGFVNHECSVEGWQSITLTFNDPMTYEPLGSYDGHTRYNVVDLTYTVSPALHATQKWYSSFPAAMMPLENGFTVVCSPGGDMVSLQPDAFVSPELPVTRYEASHPISFETVPGLEAALTEQIPYGFPIRNYPLESFKRSVFSDMDNLLPATFYAAQTALNDYTSVISTNMLEALSDLRDIGSLVPDLRSIAELLRNIASGDFVGGLLSAIDTYTDLYLYKSFGLDPNLSLSKEIIEKFRAVISRLSKIGGGLGQKTLYGSRTWTLPSGQYGFGETRLTARAKVCVGFDNSSLLVAMLGFRALGLKPGLSTIYECLPFSFVLDDIINLGDALEAADDRAFMLMLPVYYGLYSIKVEAKIDTPYFRADSSDWENALKAVAYRRYTSAYLPPLRSSKYDFVGEKDLSLNTSGSLLWTTIVL
jgi:hypothetical protein